MVSTSPYRAIKKRAVCNLLLINLLFFLPLSLTRYANAQVTTSSGYNLIGTIRSGDFSGAVIIVAKGEQSFFRLFEKLPDGSQIVQVRDDSISLKGADGTLYDMYISHEKIAGSAVSPISADYHASESAPKQYGPTPAQQERLNKIRQRALDRAQRLKEDE
jgi:hypothetical protein